jgi:hypothetical protein
MDVSPMTGQLQTQATTSNQTPTEGPKVIPVILDFTQAEALSVDLGYQQQQLLISAIQSVFVDNSLNESPLAIVVGNNVQTLSVPGGYQGYLNVDCPNPPKFILSCAGGQKAKIIFQNYEVNPILWDAAGGGGGTQVVSDPILESTVANGALNVNIVSGGGGGGSGAPAMPGIETVKVTGDAGTPSGSWFNGAGSGTGATVYSISGWNQSAAAVFLHLIPHSGNPGGNTDGWCAMIPAGGSIFHDFSVYGLPFGLNSGLSGYLSSGDGDGDTTAVTGECGFMVAFAGFNETPY